MRIKNKKNKTYPCWLLFLSTIVLLFLPDFAISAQSGDYNYFYRVYFKDKGENNLINYSLSDLLSPKAIQRRNKQNIEEPDFNDVPVFKGYLDQIASNGFTLHCTSKWMNTALFKSKYYKNILSLVNLQYVSDIKVVKSPVKTTKSTDKLKINYNDLAYPPSYDKPIEMLNGTPLHLSGYNGKGVTIAVLDAGFSKAITIPSLFNLTTRKGITGTYDFVLKNENVYGYSDHGTAVLSVLAGELTNQIRGTAPGADYWLFRTEDVYSEYPVEEDYWIAAAEFADSIGVDLITSSLGYFKFDDSSLDYKFQDLDGKTAFITKAADIAASKGILVVVSAGNERSNTWQRIVAPSDGKNVIGVGAVDENGNISSFSSAGPSSDGRIKPDNVTMGVNVPVQTNETTVLRANGTSFSCPVLSGLCACLIQAIPQATNIEIIEALHSNANYSFSPDPLYGYGIPDMVKTITWLQDKLILKPDSEASLNPNPVKNDFELSFIDAPGKLAIEIYTSSGVLIKRKSYPDYIGRSLTISDIQNLSQGMYIVRIITGSGIYTHKIIKLNN
jgi:serine protease AprX